jgi:glycosyltransferase involved in cell wall biosynthesis
MNKPNLDLIIETSWEVCNKVGGIYTVLSTKAKTLQALYKDKVIFIGPDVWTDKTPSPYFTESRTLLKEWRRQLSLPNGVKVRVGRWNIPGRPIVILVKFDSLYAVNNQFYGNMWEGFGVDSLHAYGDYDEACAFSHASGLVIENLCNFIGTTNHNIVAHFDEWTTGMGLLYVKQNVPEVATIFTTHATSIGRSICGNGKQLYAYLSGYNGDQMARELNMEAKHSVEKTAAHQADCFTTVSDITAIECEQLLERRPLVTPNGFEANFVPSKSQYPAARDQARKTLLNVGSALCGYDLPEDSFIVGTSGRCEFRNKGLDVFIDAIKRLEQLLPTRTILCYVMVPAWVNEARQDLKADLTAPNRQHMDDPIITHTLHNYDQDPIVGKIHQHQFNNGHNSQVKIVYVPCYLNGADGIFDMTYYELLAGMDATVFPSYYEPWGYTPLESIAFGIPTVTTSLSGFGQWILGAFDNKFDTSGVHVIQRTDSNYCSVVDEIARDIMDLSTYDTKAMRQVRNAAMCVATKAAWKEFITNYELAYVNALQAMRSRICHTNIQD